MFKNTDPINTRALLKLPSHSSIISFVFIYFAKNYENKLLRLIWLLQNFFSFLVQQDIEEKKNC